MWIVAFDFVSTVAFCAALVIVAKMRRETIAPQVRLFLMLAMLIYAFVSVSNVLEHSGITSKLDAYEDYAEILFLPFALFFLLSMQTAREYQMRAQTEIALRESEGRYRTLVENIDLGITLISPDYVILVTNAKVGKMFGKPVSELIGRNCFREFEKRTEPCSHCPGAKAMATGKPSKVETEGVRDDGGRFNAYIHALPVFREDGEPDGFIEVVEDVTEHKRDEQERLKLEAQVQHSQKLESLGVLAGGIAHDFNNLLLAILGNADLALLEMSPESAARASVTEIKNASQRAAELARQMLAYSGKGTFIVEPIDLSKVVEEMAHILNVSVSKTAVLKYEFADNLPAIEADATQIRQVIMNLITNASEAIGNRSGTVSVSTGAMHVDRGYLRATYIDENLPEGLYVTLEVSDTGCGMDAETQGKLFDPFFTTKFTGRGLGMAAVLGIIRAHHGTIMIDSEQGKGTTIRVLLPALEVQATPDAAGSTEQWHGTGTVLLVDDEETVRAIGRRMLERIGMTVITAVDGLEAVQIYAERADDIDCVILDLTMPRMGGEEALIELRAKRSDVHVIISSGYSEQDVMHRFKEKGAIAFIHKPYELDALAATLRAVVGEHAPLS